jgi:DNA modification methylase
LPAHFIQHFAKESVIDFFGGTGTTMIAAEQLGKMSFLMELDPHYCDVIIARWEKLTGQTAKLLKE